MVRPGTASIGVQAEAIISTSRRYWPSIRMSGDLVWHYQTTPGDTWDFTATQHIILADLEIKG